MAPPEPKTPSPSRPWHLSVALGCLALGVFVGLQSRPEEPPPEVSPVETQLRLRLAEARMASALVPVHGPGIEVVLEDSSGQPAPLEDPYDFVVHDVDLLALVNELWAAGAEAVAVDDVRLGVGSSIRCVGPTVLVDGQRVAAPYRVLAIGRAEELQQALKMPGGFVGSMERLVRAGGRVTVKSLGRVDLPAGRAPRFESARPRRAPAASPETVEASPPSR